MQKLIVMAVAALLGTTAVASAADATHLTSKQIIQKVRKGVIRVQCADVREDAASTSIGGGSGFVFEVDYDKGIAYGITNHHVAGHASSVSAMFWNGTIYNGEMVATEPGIDVSLIRLRNIPDERNLPDSDKTIIPVVLGDSDKVQIGEMGIAMGSPGTGIGINVDRSNPYDAFLLSQTATMNVVTGRETPLDFEVGIWQQNRSGGGDVHELLGWQYGTNFDYTFRMSTAINPGNSGGPLFDREGRVIGINFYGGSGGITQNSNSAIPINLAKDFVYQILNTGKFEKPWVGLDIIFPPTLMAPTDRRQTSPLEKYIEFRERRPQDKIEIYNVRKGSPAEAAGFMKGDVITDINGQRFKTPEDVRLWIFTQSIGAPINVRVLRNGKLLPQPIQVKVGPKRTYDAEFSV